MAACSAQVPIHEIVSIHTPLKIVFWSVIKAHPTHHISALSIVLGFMTWIASFISSSFVMFLIK